MSKHILYLLAILSLSIFSSCEKEESSSKKTISPKKIITGKWTSEKSVNDYSIRMNTGENRAILLIQEDSHISETTSFLHMSSHTQDSLQASQDTTISWNGKVIESDYSFNEDGTFSINYEYILEKTTSTYFEYGTTEAVPPYIPAFPGKKFTLDSINKKNYRVEYTGAWNLLASSSDTGKTRLILEIETEIQLNNYLVFYICNAEDDTNPGYLWNQGVPIDTTFSSRKSESINNNYAIGEKSKIWDIESFTNSNITLSRNVSRIFHHSYSSSPSGMSFSLSGQKIGSEKLDLVPSIN